MAQHLSEGSNVHSILAVQPEVELSLVVVSPSLVEEVTKESHPGQGTAHEGVHKVLRQLLPSDSSTRMKSDVQIHLICDTCLNPMKPQRAALNRIPTSPHGAILGIDVLGGKTSVPTSKGGNKYIVRMVDLFTRFGVPVSMSIKLQKRW